MFLFRLFICTIIVSLHSEGGVASRHWAEHVYQIPVRGFCRFGVGVVLQAPTLPLYPIVPYCTPLYPLHSEKSTVYTSSWLVKISSESAYTVFFFNKWNAYIYVLWSNCPGVSSMLFIWYSKVEIIIRCFVMWFQII